MACASSDGQVSILSRVGEEWQSQVISAHISGCNSVSWCPSAIPSTLLALDFNALEAGPVALGPKMIATGGCDNTVKIWKAVIEEKGDDGAVGETWKLEATLNDHSDWVRDVCWRPNLGQVGHLLVSCSQDNSVLIWKCSSAEGWKSKKLKPTPFPDTLWRVSFSEYGHLLAVSCGDNTVTLWRESPEDGNWELVGNVDESVTETAKIEEPLAVEPPASAPIPEINFNSAPKFASDAGYMKPMSPMIPVPSASTNNSMSTGYNQFNQAYDNFQHAQHPTIPSIQNNLLANPVIPEANPTNGEFNKDIGFIGSPQVLNQQAVDAPVSYEQSQIYETPTYEQPTYEQPSYEQHTYEQPNYEQSQVYEPTQYDQQAYDQAAYNYEPQSYEQPSYEPQSFEQPAYAPQAYEPQAYEQSSYEDSGYEQPTYDQAPYEQPVYEQSTYEPAYEQPVYEQPTYEPTYEQPTYEPASSQEQSAQQASEEVNYTLQYEGYQSEPVTDGNSAVNF